MKTRFIIAMFMALSLGAGAQEMANIGKTINVVSPEVNGTTVTFRLEAPDARSVQVNGTMNEEYTIINRFGGEARACRPKDMVKNADGVWEYTCTCSPNFYNYVFIVDGLSICDPANPYRQRDGYDWLSAFIVDGDYSANYREANQRGNLHQIWYDSPSLNANRRMIVYTPYGYDENPDKRYPVLYLMHGGMRDEEQWADLGLVRQILDNRIEKGEAEPMIVVMPNYRMEYAAAEHIEVPGYRFKRQNALSFSRGNFPQSLKEDIIPYIDSHFRTIPDKAHRAVGGFSMGSITSSNCFLALPDLIGSLFVVPGSARDTPQAAAQWENVKAKGYNLIYVATGIDDTGYEGCVAMHNLLDRLEMWHVFSVTPGGHAWYNCRHHLNAVVPLLFKE